jgi:hypothetical protein
MLNDQQRQTFSSLADILIPSAEGMPSASEAEVPTRFIDEALGYRPDLEIPFLRALELSAELPPDEAVQMLNTEHTTAFDALGVLTSGAYFLNPTVKDLIGYPGQVPTPAREDIDSYAEMLAAVVERGPIYRPTVR